MIATACWALAILMQTQAPPTAPPPPSTVIRGIVVDARNKTPVADAQITVVDLDKGVRSGADGRFELKDIPPGPHAITVSMIGYTFVRRELDAGTAAVELTIPLSEGTGTYKETVTVTADTTPPPAVGVPSQMYAGSAALQELRGVTTDDPMRAVQALPGVATGDDFSAEFSVRGAAFRHLGVVIDGTPSTMLLHAVRARENTGSIAMINTDVLDSASLFAGAHPQRNGDWIGASLEFSMRDGTRDRTTLRAAVSGTSASVVLEGPIGPGKRGSWLLSLRRSYLDWLIRKLEPDIDSTIGFYDGQVKGVYDLTNRQQLQIVVVAGDAIYRETQASLANGLIRALSSSTLASVAWRYVRDRWLLTERVSFLGSDFKNTGAVGQKLARGYAQSLIARTDFARPLGRQWALDAGIRGEWSELNQILADFAPISGGGVRLRSAQDESAHWTIASGWAQVTRRTDTGGVVLGFRASQRSGGADPAVSPWLMGERRVGAFTVRASGGLAAQFLDPTMITAEHSVDPERARFVDASVEHRLGAGTTWQATVFDRREADVLRRIGEDRLDPVTGKRIVATTFPLYRPSLDGSARGVDLVLMRRAASGLTGWIGYTWSHTHYRDTVSGEAFDGDFDQRHTLNIFAQQRLSFRMTVSAKLRVGSNFPVVGYFDRTLDDLHLSAERNQVRLPRYARLDLRANRTFTFDRRRLTLFVEVMNATGRSNYGQADGAIRSNLDAVGYAERLIPFVPSAGFLIEF